jgi:branched-chain amino acid transport system ATP-binding protein
MALLDVEDLRVRRGGATVIWDISLEIPEGQVVSLLGSNGAGKTTTLEAIVGILGVQSGSIRYRGEDLSGTPYHERVADGIVYVPERENVFRGMTVEENLHLGSYPKHSRASKEANLEWIYELFPRLEDRKTQTAGSLSGGEMQMLIIGRELMSDPSLLLLDEPSMGIAPKIVEDIFDRLATINAEEDVTVLLVEQNLRKSLDISDYAYIIENGRISHEGEPDAVMENEEVRKSFLGK